MEETDNIYDHILKMFGRNPGHLAILEQQIDAEVQLEYYDCAESQRNGLDPEEIMRSMDTLFMQNISETKKKKILVQLAAIDRIEAYRTLEKFVQNRENGLTEWATLALQESRLLLESRLLDENRVLISTGLGGKGLKIRYYTVLMSRAGRSFTAFEQKLVSSEIRFSLKRCRGELEALRFDKELCTILSVIPLNVPIQELFDNLVAECNQFDDFLNPDCMITNVKILSGSQIRKMIRKNRIQKNPDK